MKTYTRPLTQREADRCEQASEPVCVCRCGGRKHGAKRVPKGGDFSVLPMDDPHYRPELTPKQAIRTVRNAVAKMSYPRLVDRDSYIGQHGFDAWAAVNAVEQRAYNEAVGILLEAIKALKGTAPRNS